MSCSSNDDVITGATTSISMPVSSISSSSSSSPSSSSTSSSSTGSTITQSKSMSIPQNSTAQIQKTAIVAGNQQLIIQKLVSQPGQSTTQKVVSVTSTTNGTNHNATPSTVGSSSTTIIQSTPTNIPISQSSCPTTSSSTTTAVVSQANTAQSSYTIHNSNNENSNNNLYATINGPFYNQNNQNSNCSANTISSTSEQQSAVYFMYPDTSMDLDSYADIEGHVSHTAQAAPITVQWLVDNFEPAEGCSLRRSSLYNFYIHHCSEQKLEPVNPASFGKLIRSVFLGLRTRRLGTRGNSKYHYYGIRVKVTSPLNQLPEDHTFAIRHHSINNSKRLKTAVYFEQDYKPIVSANSSTNTLVDVQNTQHSSNAWQGAINHQHMPTTVSSVNSSNNHHNNDVNSSNNCLSNTVSSNNQQSSTLSTINNLSTISSNTNGPNVPNVPTASNSALNDSDIKIQTHQEFIKPINNLPNLGCIKTDNIILPENCDIDDLRKFEKLYKLHCEKILDLVIGLKLSNIDIIWQKFWRCSNVDCSDYEQDLSTEKFVTLCNLKPVIEFVKKCDYHFYQFCVDTLIPDVLRVIPGSFTQQIRNFAKSLDTWLKNALVNVPQEMRQTKLQIINAFAMTLRRYTTLNHLAQAAKALLQNAQQINQMLSDLNRVDFHNVQEQASWVCQCDDSLVIQFEKEFKKTLQDQSSLEEWAKWLDTVVTIYLQPFEGSDKYPKVARQFLLKWSFYCSTVIRDLTLRSASSFGSFHLIRLLYDEYMFYLIEHKIAKVIGETAIAVMSDLKLVVN